MTPEQIQLNRNSAANVIKARLGLQDKARSDWSYDQSVEYIKALSAYIAANPSLFSEGDLITAKDVQNTDYGIVSDYTVSDAFSDFGSESFNQLVGINSAVNPFSQENRGKLFTLVAAGLLVYFLAPVIIGAIRQPVTAK